MQILHNELYGYNQSDLVGFGVGRSDVISTLNDWLPV